MPAQGFVHGRRIGIGLPAARAPWALTRPAPRHQMSPTDPSHVAAPPLAGAFLALADIGDADGAEPRRSLVAVLAALAATAVIALSAPLAWASAPAPKPSDQPSATKAAIPTPDDDGADGGA